jgi:UDP-N-acetylmuramate--alanine ligase
MVVDDYGHHPTEIAAVLAAARSASTRRIVVAFQPHRYSRTAALLEDFGRVLSTVDELVLTDIYAASEDPIPGVTAEAVADAVARYGRPPIHLVHAVANVASMVASIARPGDLVLTLGAGSIGSVGEQVLDELRERADSREQVR